MQLIHKIKFALITLVLCVIALSPMQTLAQANYNCDVYGAGEYQNNQCFVPDPGNGGRLTNTGRNILLFGGIGLLGAIGGAALLYFTVKQRRKDKQE